MGERVLTPLNYAAKTNRLVFRVGLEAETVANRRRDATTRETLAASRFCRRG